MDDLASPPDSQTALPSRRQYLDTGLIPASNTDSTLKCLICMQDATDAVHPGCHETHVYCRECIVHWLTDSEECPLCKTRLFTPSPPWLSQVLDAQRLLNRREELHELEFFGTDPSNNCARVSQSIIDGHWGVVFFIIDVFMGRPVVNGILGDQSHRGLIKSEQLAIDFVIMGNYLPALAETIGFAYTAEQQEQWKLLLTTLWSVLKKRDGKNMNARPSYLHKKLSKKLKSLPDTDLIRFLHPDPDANLQVRRLVTDLDCMLGFMCYCMRMENLAAVALARELAKQRREERKMRNRMPWVDRLMSRFGFW